LNEAVCCLLALCVINSCTSVKGDKQLCRSVSHSKQQNKHSVVHCHINNSFTRNNGNKTIIHFMGIQIANVWHFGLCLTNTAFKPALGELYKKHPVCTKIHLFEIQNQKFYSGKGAQTPIRRSSVWFGNGFHTSFLENDACIQCFLVLLALIFADCSRDHSQSTTTRSRIRDHSRLQPK